MSNFDSSLRDELLQEYITKYKKENVLLIRRSYLFFFFVVLSPLVGMLLVIVILFSLWLIINTWYTTIDNIVMLLILAAWILLMVSTLSRIIKRYWDYTMDFALVTPHEIIHYNQQWVLNRTIKTMDMEKVKTINVKWWWFIESFFDFGSLVFLSEWDSEYGDLTLSYVSNPTLVKWKIMDIKMYWEELYKK